MTSLVKKYLLFCFTIIFTFLAISLYTTSCSKQKSPPKNHLSNEDRVWMEKFFRDVMLHESAIYTLWGEKPITGLIIEHFTQEEIEAYYNSLTESELKKSYILDEPYDLLENWEKWKKLSLQIPMKNYLFFESRWEKDPSATFIYFVNIEKTVALLEKHYEIFRNIVQFEFDPKQVVYEMPTPTSPFWDKTKESALAWGLLFGFGEENSLIFDKKYFGNQEEQKAIDEEFIGKVSHERFQGVVTIGLDNFRIPSFMSFEKDDHTIHQYELERERIKKIYENQDFLSVTLEKLTRS